MKKYILARMSNKILMNCAGMILKDGSESAVSAEVIIDYRYQNVSQRLTAMQGAIQSEEISKQRARRDQEILKRNKLLSKLTRNLKGKLDSLEPEEVENAQLLYDRIKSFVINFSKLKRAEQVIHTESVVNILQLPEYTDAITFLKLGGLIAELAASVQLADKYYRETSDENEEYRETTATTVLHEQLEQDLIDFELWVISKAVVTELSDWSALQKQVNNRYESAVRSSTKMKKPDSPADDTTASTDKPTD